MVSNLKIRLQGRRQRAEGIRIFIMSVVSYCFLYPTYAYRKRLSEHDISDFLGFVLFVSGNNALHERMANDILSCEFAEGDSFNMT
jgi:hypothetical protein